MKRFLKWMAPRLIWLLCLTCQSVMPGETVLFWAPVLSVQEHENTGRITLEESKAKGREVAVAEVAIAEVEKVDTVGEEEMDTARDGEVDTVAVQEEEPFMDQAPLPKQSETLVKVREIPAEEYESYDALVGQFYVIDQTTMADASLLDAKRFLEKDLRIIREGDGPQILIYHTHSQEAFLDSVEGDVTQTVVGVGEKLARLLREEYGYEVLHHEAVYDKPSRDGAYSRALPEIRSLLDRYPTIQVVIDLHRDEMPENVHLVTELDGKPTARFMFFNGISRTRKTGALAYLQNDHLEDNLAFSFQMEKAALEYFPNLTRKIYLKGYRYNMHLCPKTLLVELGAQNNTVEEAMNACEPLAALLDLVLSGKAREVTDGF